MTHQPSKPRSCPVCGTTVTERFVRLKQVPVNCSALCHTRGQAETTARADIELAICRSCGMIFNATFDGSLIEYNLAYENTLSYSPAFRLYAEELAKRLVTSHGLQDKDILEIGCGHGEFLDRLCELGHNRGVGFDPSASSRQMAGLPEIVPTLFAPESKPSPVDFVACRHVLEHIEAPQELLFAVRRSLSKRSGSLYFEVPNADSVLDGPSTWDVIYPHCAYYTAPSLRYLFQSSGFEVTRIQTTYGGQFLGIDAIISDRDPSVRPDPKAAVGVSRLADRFEARLRESIFRWSRFIEYASVEGRRVVLWGAGAKSVTFLNVIPGAERILAVVDLNPRKHGTFVPGTAHPVIPAVGLADYDPDIVIVLNPLYQAEIERSLSQLVINPLVTVDAQLPLSVRARNLKRAAAM